MNTWNVQWGQPSTLWNAKYYTYLRHFYVEAEIQIVGGAKSIEMSMRICMVADEFFNHRLWLNIYM